MVNSPSTKPVSCFSSRAFPVNSRQDRETGSLITEIIVAIAILSIAALPLMSAVVVVQRSIRHSYQRAIAMEAIDGEMEILLAGGWRNYSQGPQPYELHGDAVKNLPPGHATLTINGRHVGLEWTPDRAGGKIIREGDVR